MIKRIIPWVILLATSVTVTLFVRQHASAPTATVSPNAVIRVSNASTVNLVPANISEPITDALNTSTEDNQNTAIVNTAPETPSEVDFPIANFYDRITKKPFGIYITPKTSPVQPERFQGYHTGVDAETTSTEQTSDIPVFSVADGTVVLARYVSGYGGVIMIRHVINGTTSTTLYGHLRQSSFSISVGSTVKKGQRIAVLGTGGTSETNGERKHLHFGVLKGSSTNVKGYVSTKNQLSSWEDPVAWLKSLHPSEP